MINKCLIMLFLSHRSDRELRCRRLYRQEAMFERHGVSSAASDPGRLEGRQLPLALLQTENVVAMGSVHALRPRCNSFFSTPGEVTAFSIRPREIVLQTTRSSAMQLGVIVLRTTRTIKRVYRRQLRCHDRPSDYLRDANASFQETLSNSVVRAVLPNLPMDKF